MAQYPEDEFDRTARSRGPKGVHRPAEPTWKRFAPLAAAAVLGPLLAWGTIAALNSDGQGTTAPSATTPAATETSSTPAETSAPPTETATETPTEAPQPNFAAPVAVKNGTGTAGLAGRTVEKLTALGFTDATASDYSDAEPTASTVFYATPELAATANFIGDSLGITSRVEDATKGDSITVVLRGDFTE